MQLEISHLSKTYANGVLALDDVSRTIATLQDADSGSIRLADLDVLQQKDQVRTLLGYLPQDFGVYPKISACDMLDQPCPLERPRPGPQSSGRRHARTRQSVRTPQESPGQLFRRHPSPEDNLKKLAIN